MIKNKRQMTRRKKHYKGSNGWYAADEKRLIERCLLRHRSIPAAQKWIRSYFKGLNYRSTGFDGDVFSDIDRLRLKQYAIRVLNVIRRQVTG